VEVSVEESVQINNVVSRLGGKVDEMRQGAMALRRPRSRLRGGFVKRARHHNDFVIPGDANGSGPSGRPDDKLHGEPGIRISLTCDYGFRTCRFAAIRNDEPPT
jgi:hypothetical protein